MFKKCFFSTLQGQGQNGCHSQLAINTTINGYKFTDINLNFGGDDHQSTNQQTLTLEDKNGYSLSVLHILWFSLLGSADFYPGFVTAGLMRAFSKLIAIGGHLM